MPPSLALPRERRDYDLIEDRKLEVTISGNSTRQATYVDSRPVVETWSRVRRLGAGTFGMIWLELNTAANKLRAVKELRKDDAQAYLREIGAIAKFARFQPFFAEFYGWYETPEDVFLVMEYFEFGDLSVVAKASLPEHEVASIIAQVLQGVRVLHDRGFTHRDLKPQNILVRFPGPKWIVKIVDFGVASRIQTDYTIMSSFRGTLAYMAPEIFHYVDDDENLDSYTNAVDIWSVGCIAYQLLTAELPFNQSNGDLKKYCLGKIQFPIISLRNRDVSVTGTDVIRQMLEVLPAMRPTALSVLQAPWFHILRSSHEHTNTFQDKSLYQKQNRISGARDERSTADHVNFDPISADWSSSQPTVPTAPTADSGVENTQLRTTITSNSTPRYPSSSQAHRVDLEVENTQFRTRPPPASRNINQGADFILPFRNAPPTDQRSQGHTRVTPQASQSVEPLVSGLSTMTLTRDPQMQREPRKEDLNASSRKWSQLDLEPAPVDHTSRPTILPSIGRPRRVVILEAYNNDGALQAFGRQRGWSTNDLVTVDRVLTEAFLFASKNGKEQTARAFLEYVTHLNTKNENGHTALIFAAQMGRTSLMSELIDHGANYNLSDVAGWTPLHHAAAFARTDSVETLIKCGAAVDARTKNLETPVHRALVGQVGHAMEWERCNIMILLMKSGARLDSRDKHGRTPFRYAVASQNKHAMIFILQAGVELDQSDTQLGLSLRIPEVTGLINEMRQRRG